MDLICMAPRAPASRPTKVALLTPALGGACHRPRLADRQVMEIRTDVSRYAS
jgi:hypothetical protein